MPGGAKERQLTRGATLFFVFQTEAHFTPESAARSPSRVRKEEKERSSEASLVQADGSTDNPRRVGTLPLPAPQGMAQEEQRGAGEGGKGDVSSRGFCLLLLPRHWAGGQESPPEAEPGFGPRPVLEARAGHWQSPQWKWASACFTF